MNAPRVLVILRSCAVVVFLMHLFAGALYADRADDVIVMKNGDRFSGEIKNLKNGLLKFKAGYMYDSVQLDWRDVKSIESPNLFVVTLSDGRRVSEKINVELVKETGEERFTLGKMDKGVTISPKEVIAIDPDSESFWKQATGEIEFGLDYANGNSPLTLSTAGNFEYLSAKHVLDVTGSTQFANQSSAPDTLRVTFNTQYERTLWPRWFAIGVIDLLHSTQQELNLRTTVGGGLGKRIVMTDRSRFSVFGGAVFTREDYFPSTSPAYQRNNAEGMFGAKYETFRFKDLDVGAQGFVYPSMTEPGRVRMVGDSSVKIEFWKDFTWNFRVYENFDSRPPGTARRNDLGVTTSLGWSF